MIDLIGRLLEREGGYVADPDDSGGATKYGITQEVLAEYRGHPVTPGDVMDLSEGEARAIYQKRYLDDPGISKLRDPDLLELMFDSVVQHGAPRPIRWLQASLGLTQDGSLGPQTLEAANTRTFQAYRGVLSERVKFYGQIITINPKLAKFAKGWMARIAPFIVRAP